MRQGGCVRRTAVASLRVISVNRARLPSVVGGYDRGPSRRSAPFRVYNAPPSRITTSDIIRDRECVTPKTDDASRSYVDIIPFVLLCYHDGVVERVFDIFIRFFFFCFFVFGNFYFCSPRVVYVLFIIF